jgi:glycosyltransferase involved in cell wall biosynthesis
LALKYRKNNVVVIHDFPLSIQSRGSGQVDVKTDLGLRGMMVIYVGNLEAYQGIDLLLESFSLALKIIGGIDLVIIGGEERDIKAYKGKSNLLGIDSRVHFLGKRPLEDLAGYLEAADILVSPRIRGKNTPMKLYSYLRSEKPVLVTNVESHTQIVNDEVTFIADPEPEAFANGMITLLQNESLRSKLGFQGKQWVEKTFSFEKSQKKLNSLLDELKESTAERPF